MAHGVRVSCGHPRRGVRHERAARGRCTARFDAGRPSNSGDPAGLLPARQRRGPGWLFFIGLWDAAITRYFLWSLPGVAVATLLGRGINRRMKGDRFIRFVYGGLLVIAAVLLVQAMIT